VAIREKAPTDTNQTENTDSVSENLIHGNKKPHPTLDGVFIDWRPQGHLEPTPGDYRKQLVRGSFDHLTIKKWTFPEGSFDHINLKNPSFDYVK
jgi:hypothetical protein